MCFSDEQIKVGIESGELGSGYDMDLVQPASVDVRLGDSILELTLKEGETAVDMRRGTEQLDQKMHSTKDGFILHPGKMVLGSTKERIRIPKDCYGELLGKSSIGRHGLLVHVTAGFLDPGFEGWVTLELSVIGDYPIELHAGQLIGQVTWGKMDQVPAKPYGSFGNHYQNQENMPVAPKPTK